MSVTWHGVPTPEPERVGPGGWALAVLRGVPMVLVLVIGLTIMRLIRLVERPIFGLNRPVTPWITTGVCTLCLWFMGMRLRTSGTLMTGPGAMVANHSSWTDILVLNARRRVYFVSKADVAGWPGISSLAKATGTIFIERERRAAAAQVKLLRERLTAGHRLLFFPEGTSTDGRRVLPLKSTLFAAFLGGHLPPEFRIQPVSVIYHAPRGERADFYGWWGGMDMGPHLLKVLAARPQGSVEVIYHDPIPVSDASDRKLLAARCEETLREAMEARIGKA